MQKSIWGHTAEGVAVPIFTLANHDVEVRVMAYGARLVSVRTADRAGRMADIVLGYDTLQGYLDDNKTYLGAIVGRYGNRIAEGKFSIDGKSYQVPVNDSPNALHGGPVGFDRAVWQAREDAGAVEFTHVSPDGDMGFPGTLTATARYSLEGNALRIAYTAVTDQPTVLNLTNHAYFNLRGDDDGDILGHRLELRADRFTPVSTKLIPEGELAPVAGTPLDFRNSAVVGARIHNENEQLKRVGGYDHNFVVNGRAGTLRLAAVAADPERGRQMIVETTEPGIQFYSGNFLDGSFTGRHGAKYARRTGFCLETQHFPDSPNHPDFPTTVLRPGETYRSTTIFTFGAA
jgi:aldose 1-epimerase